MILPENIVKLLSSGLDADIEIGLMLALKYVDNEDYYRDLILDVYHNIDDFDKKDALNQFCIWRQYFRDNKDEYEKGNNSKALEIK